MNPTHYRVIRARAHHRISTTHAASGEFQHCPINAYLIDDLRAAYAAEERRSHELEVLYARLRASDLRLQRSQADNRALQDVAGDAILENTALRRRNRALCRETLRVRRAALHGWNIPARTLPATFETFLEASGNETSENETSEEEAQNIP